MLLLRKPSSFLRLPLFNTCIHPLHTHTPAQDPEGKPKKANIRDNHDGTYLVSYVPDMTGRYTILIKYGGDEIPYSPYRIRALPTGDASKCTVTGTQRTRPFPRQEVYVTV